MTIHVQFSDGSEATIMSVFASPQDPSVWPNQGEVHADDLRYLAYVESLPLGLRGFLPSLEEERPADPPPT